MSGGPVVAVLPAPSKRIAFREGSLRGVEIRRNWTAVSLRPSETADAFIAVFGGLGRGIGALQGDMTTQARFGGRVGRTAIA